MDIFTDASLNDKKKVAGVSAIFVPSKTDAVTCYNSYCSVSKIETAELLAIAMALSLLDSKSGENVRVVSDSKGALRKLQSIFHHPSQGRIQKIKDFIQIFPFVVYMGISIKFKRQQMLIITLWRTKKPLSEE